MWARSAPAPDFLTSVRQIISALLPWGYPDINRLAAAAGLSVRSFQRQPSQANLSYAKLVEQVRFDQAVRWLQDPTVKLTDIAMELGYAEPANFSRAFKRWTGTSPREFRMIYSEKSFHLGADEVESFRGGNSDLITSDVIK